LAAIAIGALAGWVCHVALRAKTFFKYDDALDVIAVHFVGGVLGSLLLGFFGDSSINPIGADGIFFGGGVGLLGNQVLALASVIAFSFCATWVIAVAIDKTIGLRVAGDEEDHLDQVQQGMDAYHFSRVAGLNGTPAGSDLPVDDRRRAIGVDDADTRLVTALVGLESIDAARVTQSLLAAGASSIAVSEAQTYTRQGDSRTIRGERREVDLPYRARFEVLVPQSNVDAVLAAFDRVSAETDRTFVQTVEPVSSHAS
jgi:ammonium transporter, Amt family